MESNFEFKEINSKFIISDQDYQREVNPARVAKMLKRFNPTLVNPPKLSFRDGRYYVFDGGHTTALLKARNGGKDLPILCKVFYGLTKLDEAILFEEQNGEDARAVQAVQKARSRFNRGADREVNAVRLAESVGFSVDFLKNGQSKNRINAVVALLKIYDRLGSTEYVNTLSIIKAAWDGSTDSTRKEILDGMAIFCANYAGQYDRAMLIRKLRGVPAIEIIRNGRVSTSNGSRKYAQQIVNIYNKNMRNRLDDVL